MTKDHIQTFSFFTILILVSLALIWLLRFFAEPLLYAILIAVFSYPLYTKLVSVLKGKHALAALCSIFALFVFILVPLSIIAIFLIRDSLTLYSAAQAQVGQWFAAFDSTAIQRIEAFLPQTFADQLSAIDWKSSAIDAVQGATRFVFLQLQMITKNIIAMIGMTFIMLYALFYFYKDGPRWVEKMMRYSPLDDADERSFFNKFITTGKATLLGTIVIGAVQGALGAIAFWMLGITAPIFWGLVMMILSVLPVVGSAFVWAPAALFLAISGQWFGAIFLTLFGIFVIGTVDNFLRPALVGKQTNMHPLVVLLSTLGGIAVFGFTGIIVGPVIAALFLTVLDIYGERYL
ncbi:MAG TPA: AI-2E family transporter [Patescibacteria group bacterium]|nr:AI-2E family transporter [Patescibacteria group bacterium]